MTGEHFDAILKRAQTITDKDGWQGLPENTFMTLHLAHEGVPLTLNRVEAVKSEGDLLYARAARRELFVFNKQDLFAVAFEGATGQANRRAGFG